MNQELSQKYLAILAPLALKDEPESAHIAADKALCDLLIELGFEDVVEAWEEVHKWYA